MSSRRLFAIASALVILAWLPHPAMAMPQLLVPALASVLGGTLLAEVAANVIVYAALSAVVFGISSALQGDPPGLGPISTEISRLRNTRRGTTEPAVVAYGEWKMGGTLVYAESADRDGEETEGAKYLHFVLALCEGPIDDIFDFELNDRSGNDRDFRDLVFFAGFNGHPEQEMMRGPLRIGETDVQLPKRWLEDGNRKLSGIAYAYCVLKHDQKAFIGGAPAVRVRGRGRLCWDPREDVSLGGAQDLDDIDTWAYSNNSAICALDYVMNKSYGMRVPLERVDLDSWIAAANACDEQVVRASIDPRHVRAVRGPRLADREPDADAVTHARYQTDGPFLTDSKPVDVLTGLVGAMAGAAFLFEGKWHGFAGVPEATLRWPNDPALPVEIRNQEVVITEADLRGGAEFTFLPKPGAQARINTINGTFLNHDEDYQEDTFTLVNEAFYTVDGAEEHSANIDLPFTSDIDRAQRIGNIKMNEARFGFRCEFPGMPRLMWVPPWSVVWVDLPTFGIKLQRMRVTRRTVDAVALAPNLFLAAYDDQIYSDVGAAVDLPPPSDLPNPFRIYKPQAVTAFEDVHTLPDGRRTSKLVVDVVPDTRGPVTAHVIEWRRKDQLFAEARATTIYMPRTRYEIIGLEAGIYVIRVRTLADSLSSASLTTSAEVTYRSAAPPQPLDFNITYDLTSHIRTFKWYLHAPPPDVAGFEVRVLLDNDGVYGSAQQSVLETEWSQATTIGNVPIGYVPRPLNPNVPFDPQNLFVRRQLSTLLPTAFGAYVAYVRTIDASGLLSDISTLRFSVTAEAVNEVVLRRRLHEEGWPGTIAGGYVASDGALVGLSDVTWDTDDPGNPTWQEGEPGELTYVTPLFDLGEDLTARISLDVVVDEGTDYRVDVSSRRDSASEPWSSFGRAQARIGRYYLLRLRASSKTGLPRVTSFSVDVAARIDTQELNDLDISTKVGAQGFYDLVDTMEQWLGGDQTGLSLTREGRARLDLPAAWLKLGASSQVSVPYSVSQIFREAFTIELEMMWDVDATDAGQLNKNVVRRGASSWAMKTSSSASDPGVVLRFAGYAGDNPNNTPSISIADDDLAGHRPYHFAFTYDGSKLRGWLDGVMVWEESLSFRLAIVSPDDLYVCGDGLQATMRNVRVWNYARTQEQLNAFRGIGLPVATPGLVTNQPFDDGVGTTAADATGGGHHGTITNPTWIGLGYRRSLDVDLSIVDVLNYVAAAYNGTQPASASTRVDVRVIDDTGTPRVDWTTLTTTLVGDVVAGKAQLDAADIQTIDPAGWKLQCRQVLSTTDVTATAPELDVVALAIVYATSTGSVTALAPKPFLRIDSAEIIAVQGASGVVSWKRAAQSRHGALFVLRDQNNQPVNPVIDVLFKGSSISLTR